MLWKKTRQGHSLFLAIWCFEFGGEDDFGCCWLYGLYGRFGGGLFRDKNNIPKQAEGWGVDMKPERKKFLNLRRPALAYDLKLYGPLAEKTFTGQPSTFEPLVTDGACAAN